jgi:protein-tyrosine-phosphatase
MDVIKLKHAGEVFSLKYEENLDLKTIATGDEPESDLIFAMDAAALEAAALFNLPDTPVKLEEIVWKDGDKAGSKCVLRSGESAFGRFKVALPKVSTQEAETPEEGVYDPANLKNRYNEAVDALRAQALRFVKGARRQRPLPFDGEPSKKKRGIAAAADKIGGLFTR